MAKLQIKKASTDVTLYVFVQDSASTTGGGKTGIAYNAASLVAYYVRPLGTATAITLATQTVGGAHSDGGWVEVDATNMPGLYRFDLPDAVCATGVNSVAIMVKGAADMAPLTLEVELVAYDPQSATSLGLSNLDTTVGSRATQTSVDTVDDFLDTEIAAIKAKTDNLPASPADEATLTTIASYIDTEVAAIKAKTDNLPASPAAVSDIPTVNDIITGMDANSADLNTIISMLTDIDNYIDTEVAAIKAKTDNLPAAPAATGDIPTTAQINAEMVDVLRTDANAELSSLPGVSPTVTQMIQFIYQYFRNKFEATSSGATLYKDDSSTALGTATVTDDGTTFTRTRVA